jgi:hypothetical protein
MIAPSYSMWQPDSHRQNHKKNSQHNAAVFKSFDYKIMYENIYKGAVKNPKDMLISRISVPAALCWYS